MANGNPFSIQQVDAPGVFGAFQQFKQNALNLQIGEEQLNAFRESRKQEKQVRQLRREAVGGSEAAEKELTVFDMNFVKSLNELQRKEAADALDEVTNLAKRGLADPSSIPAAVKEALEKFPDIPLPEGFLDLPFEQQKPILEGFVAQSLNGAELLRNPDRFEDVLNNEGELIGQRDTETNKFFPVSGGANIRPPSGFRFVAGKDGQELEAIPGGPGERQQKSLDLQTARAISQQAVLAFGGSFNPITGEFGGLDEEQTEQFFKVQTRANELLENGQADNPAEAVQLALGEIQGKRFEGGSLDDQIALFFEEENAILPDKLSDEDAKTRTNQARQSIARGADIPGVLRHLRGLGLTREQFEASGLLEEIKKDPRAFAQLQAAGIL